MATLNNYKGSIGLTGGFTPKGGQTFPLMEAHDIVVDNDDTRLDERLNNIVAGTTNALAQKVAADGTDINDYKTAGLYYFSGSYTYSNLPDQGNDYTYDDSSNGWLEVFTRGDYVKQVFHRHGSVINDNCHHTFVRNYCVYDTTADTKVWKWSEWKRFATVDDLGKTWCTVLLTINGTYTPTTGTSGLFDLYATIPFQGVEDKYYNAGIGSIGGFKAFFIRYAVQNQHYSVSGRMGNYSCIAMYHDGSDVFVLRYPIGDNAALTSSISLSDSALSIDLFTGYGASAIYIGR